MELAVGKSVYEPMEDSRLMQKEIHKRAKDRAVLDMGCGTGIQAITASESGAKEVWAVDVNPKAVRCCRENAKKSGAKVRVFESNLFEKVPNKRFDLIVFNPPYLPSDGKNDDLRWSGGYRGIEVIIDFFKRVGDYLLDGGEVLFVFSSHADCGALEKFLELEGFNLEIISVKKMFFEKIYLGIATF